MRCVASSCTRTQDWELDSFTAAFDSGSSTFIIKSNYLVVHGVNMTSYSLKSRYHFRVALDA